MSEITHFRLLVREVRRFAEIVAEGPVMDALEIEEQTLRLAQAAILAHKESAEHYRQRYVTVEDEWQVLERDLKSGGGGGRDDRPEEETRAP